MVKPLLDGDLLVYGAAFGAQAKGELRPWEAAQYLLDKQIDVICEEVGATEEPLLFFTNSEWMNGQLNRRRKYEGLEAKAYIPNFRINSAKAKPYKGGRATEKPFHYFNCLSYLLSNFNCHINEGGLEADDALAIEHSKGGNTILCSRDKDLRQVPGLFYSWEFYKQRSYGPITIDPLGSLEFIPQPTEKGKPNKPPKFFGTGAKWLYAQVLTGDGVDSISGAKGVGANRAYKELSPLTSEKELYDATVAVYKEVYKEDWEKHFKENMELVYIIRELDENGERIGWKSF